MNKEMNNYIAFECSKFGIIAAVLVISYIKCPLSNSDGEKFLMFTIVCGRIAKALS